MNHFAISANNAVVFFKHNFFIVIKFHIFATRREGHVLSTYLPSKVLEIPEVTNIVRQSAPFIRVQD